MADAEKSGGLATRVGGLLASPFSVKQDWFSWLMLVIFTTTIVVAWLFVMRFTLENMELS